MWLHELLERCRRLAPDVGFMQGYPQASELWEVDSIEHGLFNAACATTR